MRSDVIVKDTILIGDHKSINFQVSIPKGAHLLFDPTDSLTARGLEIITKPKTDTVSQDGHSVTLSSSMVVTGFKDGTYDLSAIPALITKPDGSVDTISLSATGVAKLNINTIQIDTTSYKPYDIKGQMTYPYTIADFILWIVIVLFVALLSVGGIYYFKRRKRRGSLTKDTVNETPDILALRRLSLIKAEGLCDKNKHKQYYSGVSEALRLYIESYFEVQAMEQTTEEILSSLRRVKIEKDQHASLNEILTISDLVKFAKYIPSNQDNEKIMVDAENFVKSTYVKKEEEVK